MVSFTSSISMQQVRQKSCASFRFLTKFSYFFISIIFFLPSLFGNSYSINIPKLDVGKETLKNKYLNRLSMSIDRVFRKIPQPPVSPAAPHPEQALLGSAENKLIYQKQINKYSIDVGVFRKLHQLAASSAAPHLEQALLGAAEKVNGFLQLIRYKNILPTTFLFFSGAWMIKPNFIDLVKDMNVIYSLICTLLILSSNMISNDLFDMKIDKINNPNRPLISGKIKIKEAILGLGVMLSLTEIINIMILPKKMQIIIHLSILYSLMYTPLFKKILFLKNISCASMVSYSIFFGGISVWGKGIDVTKIKFFYQIIIFVFFGSLYNEILLDVCDYEGDKKNKLYTIPTVFGHKMALNFSKNILLGNVYGNLAYLFRIGQFYYGCLFLLLCIPVLNDFYNIENGVFRKLPQPSVSPREIMHKFPISCENQRSFQEEKFNKKNIIDAINTSSKQLIFILILFCLLVIR